MRHVLSVVFGALFTVAVGWAIGRALFSRLRIQLRRGEQHLLPAIVGASLLSLLVFLLCSLNLARTEVFVPIGVACLTWGAWQKLPIAPAAEDQAPRVLRICFVLLFAFYAVVYLSNSLAPEISPDGVAYHLGFVARYFREHGFHRNTISIYGNLSQGIEMVFLFAFSIGRHSAAATVHCAFLLASPFLLAAYGRRIGKPGAGLCAGMLFFLSPLAGIDGVSAYNDVALAVVIFALFYLLEIWRTEKQEALLVPVGLLAGFSFAIKYTGFIAVLYATGVILFERRPKALAPVFACSALLALPWLIKNDLWLGNPFSPFFNRLFPNPYIHVSFEKTYTEYFRTYDLPSLKPLFYIVTTGGKLGGQLGPLFLLLPLALLSLRTSVGRRVWLAFLIFLIPYAGNIGARFLLPVLPLAALSIALALNLPGIQMALALMAGILAWPRVIDLYRSPAGGWQIHRVPWQEALRLRDSDAFLFREIPHILVARELDEKAIKGRIWSTSVTADAYTKRDVLVNYESAEGELIEDMLLTAINLGLQPTWNLQFNFPEQTLRRFRITQSATSTNDVWSIGEIQMFHVKHSVAPSPKWKITAKPNPWDIELAFDGNPATRWRTWETIHPGMYVDVDFGESVTLDRIELHCAHDQWKIELVSDIPGSRLQKLESPLPNADLRKDATRAILRRNVHYLLIEYDHPLAKDIYPDPSRWGLRLLADRNRTRLYEIE